MEIYMWDAYSCNNSSDYRLVAKFESTALAIKVNEELKRFFQAHAKHYDNTTSLDVTPAALTYGQKYGVSWEGDLLQWGGGVDLQGDEPVTGVVEDCVAIYHSYMTGYGPTLPKILQAAGALQVEHEEGPCVLYVAFDLPQTLRGEVLEQELRRLFDQRFHHQDFDDWEPLPWTEYSLGTSASVEDVAFLIHQDRCQFTCPVDPEASQRMHHILQNHGVQNPTIRLAKPQDVKTIRQLELEQENEHAEALPQRSGAFLAIPLPEEITEPQEIPSHPPKMHLLHEEKHARWPEGRLVQDLFHDGEHLHVVGGCGCNMYMTSSDGMNFLESTVPGRGLRGIDVHGQEVWICGEYGFTARSVNEGQLFRKIPTHTKACIRHITRDASGVVWAAGDDGWLACFKDHAWQQIPGLNDTILGLTQSPLGLLISTQSGELHVLKEHALFGTHLKAKVPINHAVMTPLGTLVVCGERGYLARSQDEGETFSRCKVPTTMNCNLNHLACFADGRIVGVGDRGNVVWSGDDGTSFENVVPRASKVNLERALAVGNEVYVGGDLGTILRLD